MGLTRLAIAKIRLHRLTAPRSGASWLPPDVSRTPARFTRLDEPHRFRRHPHLRLADERQAGRVETGIDVLRTQEFARLVGRRVGVLTNLPARTSDGRPTVDAIRAAPRLAARGPVCAGTPVERAAEDSAVASSLDARTGPGLFVTPL